jgi:glycosyltransferase involved in cell wall biosynthesis
VNPTSPVRELTSPVARPTFSIVTPSFNQKSFIARTIESVLAQRGDFAVEHWIIDGGSTDGTLDVLAGYGDRIRWTSEPDRGQVDAVNKGFRRATGDIVGWLNSDDVYEPGALEKVAAAFNEKPEAKWCFGLCRVIDEHDHEVRRGVTAYKNSWIRRFSFRNLLVCDFISQPAVFLKRELFDELGFLDEGLDWAFDYEYWLRIGRRYEPAIIDEYVASFRWHPESKTSNLYAKAERAALRVAKRYARGHRLYYWWHVWFYVRIMVAYTLLGWWDRLRTPHTPPKTNA